MTHPPYSITYPGYTSDYRIYCQQQKVVNSKVASFAYNSLVVERDDSGLVPKLVQQLDLIDVSSFDLWQSMLDVHFLDGVNVTILPQDLEHLSGVQVAHTVTTPQSKKRRKPHTHAL